MHRITLHDISNLLIVHLEKPWWDSSDHDPFRIVRSPKPYRLVARSTILPYINRHGRSIFFSYAVQFNILYSTCHIPAVILSYGSPDAFTLLYIPHINQPYFKPISKINSLQNNTLQTTMQLSHAETATPCRLAIINYCFRGFYLLACWVCEPKHVHTSTSSRTSVVRHDFKE